MSSAQRTTFKGAVRKPIGIGAVKDPIIPNEFIHVFSYNLSYEAMSGKGNFESICVDKTLKKNNCVLNLINLLNYISQYHDKTKIPDIFAFQEFEARDEIINFFEGKHLIRTNNYRDYKYILGNPINPNTSGNVESLITFYNNKKLILYYSKFGYIDFGTKRRPYQILFFGDANSSLPDMIFINIHTESNINKNIEYLSKDILNLNDTKSNIITDEDKTIQIDNINKDHYYIIAAGDFNDTKLTMYNSGFAPFKDSNTKFKNIEIRGNNDMPPNTCCDNINGNPSDMKTPGDYILISGNLNYNKISSKSFITYHNLINSIEINGKKRQLYPISDHLPISAIIYKNKNVYDYSIPQTQAQPTQLQQRQVLIPFSHDTIGTKIPLDIKIPLDNKIFTIAQLIYR